MKNHPKGFMLLQHFVLMAFQAIFAFFAIAAVPGGDVSLKARDMARIGDLQKIERVLITANLEGKEYPDTGCIALGFGGNDADYYLELFGGKLPADPMPENEISYDGSVCVGGYFYIKNPGANYTFALYAHMETLEKGNVLCTDEILDINHLPTPTNAQNSCYIILVN